MDCKETQIDSELLYDGRILQLYRDRVQLADGSKSDREYVHHTGGSSVLAVVDGMVYLVEQFRYPYHEMTLEIPAGKREAHETFEACAVRELQEEVGLIASELWDLGVIYPTPAYTDEPLHIYLCTACKQSQNHLDEHELLNVRVMSLADAILAVRQNRIRDAKTVVALMRYQAGCYGDPSTRIL